MSPGLPGCSSGRGTGLRLGGTGLPGSDGGVDSGLRIDVRVKVGQLDPLDGDLLAGHHGEEGPALRDGVDVVAVLGDADPGRLGPLLGGSFGDLGGPLLPSLATASGHLLEGLADGDTGPSDDGGGVRGVKGGHHDVDRAPG